MHCSIYPFLLQESLNSCPRVGFRRNTQILRVWATRAACIACLQRQRTMNSLIHSASLAPIPPTSCPTPTTRMFPIATLDHRSDYFNPLSGRIHRQKSTIGVRHYFIIFMRVNSLFLWRKFITPCWVDIPILSFKFIYSANTKYKVEEKMSTAP